MAENIQKVKNNNETFDKSQKKLLFTFWRSSAIFSDFLSLFSKVLQYASNI